MKSFLRLLEYTRNQKGRIAAIVICSVLVSVLYGGSIAAMLPMLKAVIGREGLYGWLDRSTCEKATGLQFAPAEEDFDSAYVREVLPGGPKRVLPGDRVKALNGVPLPAKTLFHRLADSAETYREITLTFERKIPTGRVEKHLVVGLTRPAWYLRWSRWASAGLASDSRLRTFIYILGFILILNLLRGGVTFCQKYIADSLCLRVQTTLRADLYRKTLALPVSFHSRRGADDIMSRFMRESYLVVYGLNVLFGRMILQPLKIVGAITPALLISWRLTLLALVTAPAALVLLYLFARRVRRYTKKRLTAWGRLLGLLNESLVGIRMVKAQVAEHIEEARFRKGNRQLRRQQIKLAFITRLTNPTMEWLGLLAAGIGIGLAGYIVIGGELDLAKFMTMGLSLVAALDPVRKLSVVGNQLQRSDVAAERIFELLDEKPQRDRPDAKPLPPVSGAIEFQNVQYTYPGASRPALDKVNLRIGPGQTVLIVGPSGCGKTTLISMIPRLFEAQSGRILIDGIDIAGVTLDSLRGRIGFACQETVLFADTIADNIAFGKDPVSRDEIEQAARAARAHEFIAQLPDGYDTKLTEGGQGLSGGQRQRLTLAREFLRSPAILILDEALSQVDADSESKIIEALEEFARDRTCLIVSHRFSGIEKADQVIVMQSGRIVDTGPHADLLKRCALYRACYEIQ